eukprot:6681317-Lingulodinium_polyedra.AAC.1
MALANDGQHAQRTRPNSVFNKSCPGHTDAQSPPKPTRNGALSSVVERSLDCPKQAKPRGRQYQNRPGFR